MANGPVLKLLFIGDVVGKGGRKAVHALLPELKKEYRLAEKKIDFSFTFAPNKKEETV